MPICKGWHSQQTGENKMSVILSYWNDDDGSNVPTTVTNEEFDSLAQLAKYCVLKGGIAGNYYIIPIAIDKENKKTYDVTHEFIKEHYQG
jgi:hypothetical protein